MVGLWPDARSPASNRRRMAARAASWRRDTGRASRRCRWPRRSVKLCEREPVRLAPAEEARHGRAVGRAGVRVADPTNSTVRSAACGPAHEGWEALDVPAPGHGERRWRCGHRSARATGAGPPRVGAAAPGAGAGSVAVSRRPITPFMHYSPRTRPALHPERSFSNMSQEMPAVNPPILTAHRGFVG